MRDLYPELEKVKVTHQDSQKITEFIEWLNGQNIELCSFNESGRKEIYWPVQIDMEKLLADYFEIDLVKVENERRALLESIQS